jgi:hypothetical protein
VAAFVILGLLSAFTGAVVAKRVKGAMSIVFGAAAAWCGVLAWLLFFEYCVPYQGGGASMWPIAQMVGGTFAAVVAGCTAAIIVTLRPKQASVEPTADDEPEQKTRHP